MSSLIPVYIYRYFANQATQYTRLQNDNTDKQESPAEARVTRDSALIPRWPSAAILDITEPETAPLDPPIPKTLA